MPSSATAAWLKIGLIAAAGCAAGRWALRRARTIDLAGKVVVITGGSRGLGLALAREFQAAGAQLALCARNADALARARRQLMVPDNALFTDVCDVRQEAQVEKFISGTIAHFGRVDVLVNSAGIITVGPMENMDMDDYREALETHLWGPLRMVHAVLPAMRRAGGGRIVNIASIGGKVSVPHLLPYSASKFALVGLSEGMRAELLRENILVTTVCPGLLRTGSPQNVGVKGQHELEYALFKLMDSLPIISMDVRAAARKIVAACRVGQAELVLGVPAKMAALAHGIAPGLVAEMMGWTNLFLPGPGKNGKERRSGVESETAFTRSKIMELTNRAAAANNQG